MRLSKYLWVEESQSRLASPLFEKSLQSDIEILVRYDLPIYRVLKVIFILTSGIAAAMVASFLPVIGTPLMTFICFLIPFSIFFAWRDRIVIRGIQGECAYCHKNVLFKFRQRQHIHRATCSSCHNVIEVSVS